MERRMTSTKLSARRPTESSKALSVGKDKTLSAVSLTKRTNSLVFDVEEIKSNLKDLQVQGREVVQHEQTVQELSAKVAVLQDAFDSLSDVCIYVEDAQKKMADGLAEVVQRVSQMEKSISTLQTQVPKGDAKRRQWQDHSERKFSDFQDAFAKLSLHIYETQADVARVKNSADHLLAREQEATHLAVSLQTTQEQTWDLVQKLKHESALFQNDFCALKEQTTSSDVALASDVQFLAKECSLVRATMTQQNVQWLSKLETLRETMDRQGKIDKSQLLQRLEVVSEAVATQELRTKESLGTLLKNHSKIRDAVDESMSICSSEIKILSQEWKTTQDEHRVKLEDLVEQLAQQGMEASQKYDALRCSVRSIAIQLNVTP